jgi:hypothetical protein
MRDNDVRSRALVRFCTVILRKPISAAGAVSGITW